MDATMQKANDKLEFISSDKEVKNISITRESLHTLVDFVDTSEYEVLFKLLLKFVPSDVPTSDEIEALEIAREQINNGEVYRLDEIDSVSTN